MAKILVLSQYWAPENGVPQRRWSWLSQVLADAGHEVSVMAPPPQNLRRISTKRWFAEGGLFGLRAAEVGRSGETIFRSGFFPSGSSLTSRALNQASVAISMGYLLLFQSKKIGLDRPEVVIGTVPALPTAFVTAIAARKFGAPYIIDLRDAWPELLHESKEWNSATGHRSFRERILTKGPLQLTLKVTELLLNRVLSHATGLVTTSQYLERSLKRKFRGQGGRRFTTTIRNVFPVETPFIAQAERTQARQLHVLYAGTIGRAQKLDNALFAAKIVQDRGYDIHLRFIGEGAAWNSLKETAKQLGINAAVLHRLPAEQLQESYSWADTALVHLAKWDPLERTVPSKTYELMEVGLHITAVVAGETAALVNTLEAGSVVPPENPEALAEAWIALLKDSSKINVSDSGRAWVKNERDEVAPRAFLDLVSKVLDRGAFKE